MPIVTPRLLIQPIQPDHAPALLEYKRESWADFTAWHFLPGLVQKDQLSLSGVEKYCADLKAKFDRREALHYLGFARDTGQLVCNGILGGCRWDVPMFTLGFGVRSGMTGRGYATELATGLTKYAFDVLKARKVAVFHADGNIASQRVIARVGFQKEGTLRSHHPLPGGRLVDEHHYGLFSAAEVRPLRVPRATA